MSTRVEELRNLLTEAAKGAIDEDTKDHIEVALTLVEELPQPTLVECPVCGRTGLPERIVNHDCETGSTD